MSLMQMVCILYNEIVNILLMISKIYIMKIYQVNKLSCLSNSRKQCAVSVKEYFLQTVLFYIQNCQFVTKSGNIDEAI